MTLKALRAIAAKRCKVEFRLLLITNRKSHIGFQMTWKSSTLDGLKGHWQPVRSAILATAGLLVYFLLQPSWCVMAGYKATTSTINLSIPTKTITVPVKSVFGWIIFHQNVGDGFDWYLRWSDYRNGFGDISSNFWLGLQPLHLLTSAQPYFNILLLLLGFTYLLTYLLMTTTTTFITTTSF